MKKTMLTCKYMLVSFSFFGAVAGAQTTQVTTSGLTDISVLPMTGPNMSDVIIDSNLTLNNGSTTYLNLYVSCYGTNLRSVNNPVSPSATIKANIKYLGANNTLKTYSVRFPAGAALSTAMALTNLTSESEVKDASGSITAEKFSTQLKDGLIRVAMTQTKEVPLDVLAAGTQYGALTDTTAKAKTFATINFEQEMPSGSAHQQFMGWNGPLTSSIRWYIAENGRDANVYAAFPGQNKYCGGYFSPLMLKFKNPSEPPLMKGRSHFPLYADDVKNPPLISWPSFEANEDVYFLALSENGNSIVQDGSQLLGDINGYENGFLNLAIYDENKDGVIDAKDPVFEKLILWKDSNHDGKSQRSEIKKLKDMGVTSISLKYEKTMREVGDFAKIMGPGEFSYVDKKGKSQTGALWDVYMKMVPK